MEVNKPYNRHTTDCTSFTGMSVSQPRAFHQKMNLLNGIVNNNTNPKHHAVTYLHDVMLKKNHGGLRGMSMQTAIQKYFETKPGYLIKKEFSETSFAIALVTPFMQNPPRAEGVC